MAFWIAASTLLPSPSAIACCTALNAFSRRASSRAARAASTSGPLSRISAAARSASSSSLMSSALDASLSCWITTPRSASSRAVSSAALASVLRKTFVLPMTHCCSLSLASERIALTNGSIAVVPPPAMLLASGLYRAMKPACSYRVAKPRRRAR